MTKTKKELENLVVKPKQALVKVYKFNTTNAPPWKAPILNKQDSSTKVKVPALVKINKVKTGRVLINPVKTEINVAVQLGSVATKAALVAVGTSNININNVLNPITNTDTITTKVATATAAVKPVSTFENIPLLGIFKVLKSKTVYLKVGNTTAIGNIVVDSTCVYSTVKVNSTLNQNYKSTFKTRFKKSKIVVLINC